MFSSVLLASTCGRDEPPPPTQEAVEQSWRRTDQAVQQAAEAEQQAQHERRLRDLERLRSAGELADLHGQVTFLRGLVAALALALLAGGLWLAVEIRRRRVLAAVLRDMLSPQEEERSRPPSPSSVLSPPSC